MDSLKNSFAIALASLLMSACSTQPTRLAPITVLPTTHRVDTATVTPIPAKATAVAQNTATPVPPTTPTALPVSTTWTLSKTATLTQYGATFQIWTSACVTSEQEGFSQSRYQQELRLSFEGNPAAEVIARRSISCLGGLGAYGLDYVGESVGGRYVYYTDAANGGPDGGGPYSSWQRPAYRFDVETRTQIAIKLDVASPDKRYAAYADPGDLTWINWSSGEIKKMPRAWKFGTLVGVAWSADSQSAAFLESPQQDNDFRALVPDAKFMLTVWNIESDRAFKIEAHNTSKGDAPNAMIWTQPNTIQLSYPDTTTRTVRFTGDTLIVEQ